jgi:molybdate/tungstate transport system substrate-binding protein
MHCSAMLAFRLQGSGRVVVVWTVAALAACGRARETPGQFRDGPLVVYTAGSLARPMRAALDEFVVREHVSYQLENAGSLETARKLTELGKIPDIVALADQEVFPDLLMPGQTTWYVRFAENRLVLAYTTRSRHADQITSDGWWKALQQPDVQVGRSDPDLDPAGYRTLMVFQLAERYYHQPGLAAALEHAAPARNMRPKEVELVALLEAGELDYAWFYESMARANNLPYLQLPGAIDLSSEADSALYREAIVRVRGSTPGDTLVMRGAPIRYAFSVPSRAPHPELATRFAAFLVSDAGRRALESAFLPTLPLPEVAGTRVPDAIANAIAPPRAAR